GSDGHRMCRGYLQRWQPIREFQQAQAVGLAGKNRDVGCVTRRLSVLPCPAHGPIGRPTRPTDASIVVVVIPAVVVRGELRPDFTAGVFRRVDVDVRDAGANRRNHFGELSRRDTLPSWTDDVGGGRRAGHRVVFWRGRRARLGTDRTVTEIRAEKYADATALRARPEMDVRLRDGSFCVTKG